MYNIIYILLILLLSSSFAFADTHTAVDCSDNEVTAAIALAADGDTVAIPTGECTWDAAVVINKGITLQGNGTANTIITDGQSSGWNNVPILINSGTTSKNIVITGFTLKRSTTDKKAQGLIYVTDTLASLRIHTMTFDDNSTTDGGRALWIGSKTPTLVDNNTFEMGVMIEQSNGNCSSDTSCAAWGDAMAWGNANGVYIENNTVAFNVAGDGFIDCQNGGKVIFRYNTVTGPVVVDNHGFDSVTRGCMQLDTYNNTFTNSGDSFPWAIKSRSGTGVIYNNVITGYYYPIVLTHYRSSSDSTGYILSRGHCDGTRATDGNTSPTDTYRGYPCLDQPGRGTDQASFPYYEWNNCKNLAGCIDGDDDDADFYLHHAYGGTDYLSTHVVENRDYHNDTEMPSYTPYTCPHPSAGLTGKTCNTTAGTSGYGVDAAPDTTAPTVTLATVGSSGAVLTLTMSEAVTVSDSTGFTLDCDETTGEGLTYASGSGTSTIIYNITGRTINSNPKETCTLAYTTVANGIEDASANDLATISPAMAVTNSSTYTPSATTYTVTTSIAGGKSKYTSDFSAGVNGWSGTNGTLTGNIDSIGAQNDNLRMTINTNSTTHAIERGYTVTAGRRSKAVFSVYIPSTNSDVTGLRLSANYWGTAAAQYLYPTTDTWTTYTIYFTPPTNASVVLHLTKTGNITTFSDAGGDDVVYLRGVDITEYGCTLESYGDQEVVATQALEIDFTLDDGWTGTWSGTCESQSTTGSTRSCTPTGDSKTLIYTCNEQYIF